jgi:hypothetical protein
VNEEAEKKDETSVDINNFSNEPKTLKAQSMISFYEKLGDETTLINVTNDLGNNWTN